MAFRLHQVLCITHLPQIAAFADRHFVAAKETKKGRTRTRVREVRDEERIDEWPGLEPGAAVLSRGG